MQDATAALRGLAVVLPVVGVLLLALAVGIARGRRRETLRAAGWCLVLAGVLVLVARSVAGQRVVDSLARTDAVVPAAQATWSIATSMLHDIAWATIVVGVPLIVAAWIAGPLRSAYALRQAAAPWLRERPEIAYGVAAALALLVIAWGPIPATRMVIPVLVMIGLLALGVALLRRQVAVEFPDANVDEAHATWQARIAHARASAERRAAAPPGSRRERHERRRSRCDDRPGRAARTAGAARGAARARRAERRRAGGREGGVPGSSSAP